METALFSSAPRLEFVRSLIMAPWVSEGHPLLRVEVPNCLKISGESETGNKEQRVSHLKFFRAGKQMEIGLLARIWAGNSGV